MMPLLNMRITARSPLAFPERKPGTQFRASLGYVPGPAIYGALGMLLGNQWAAAQQPFDSELFQQIRCHNAYPALDGDRWVHPLPITAIQPKNAGDENLPTDSLVARVCWEQQQPPALIYVPTDNDGRPWEPVGPRFYALDYAHPYRSVQQRVLTRVSINRRRGTAEDQRLYSLLALSEVSEDAPTQFYGSLVTPSDRQGELEAALQRVTRLGGRQTTGLGEVAVQVERTQPESAENIRKRVILLTNRFQNQARLYQDLGGAPWCGADGEELTIEDETIFTVNLLSDAILLDHGWLPTNELSGTMLEELTRIKDAAGNVANSGIKARLLRSFTTTTISGGWNVTWQRPKPTAVVVTMGSVFVFQAERRLDDAAYQALTHLQGDGIGERRVEGFGQVRICDNFHLLAPEVMQ